MDIRSILEELETDTAALRFNLPVNVRTTHVGKNGAPLTFQANFSVADMPVASICAHTEKASDGQLRLKLQIRHSEANLSPVQARLHHAVLGKVLELANYFDVRLNGKTFEVA
jgi:hypothetical protein